MAVVRDWTELSPSKKLGSFMNNVLFPLLAPQKLNRVDTIKCISSKSSGGGDSSNLNDKSCTKTNLFLKDNILLPLRLVADRCLCRGILLESEARRA